EPGRKGSGSLGVAGEDLSVGPLGLQGAVEAFDLAVLPGAVRPDELVLGAQFLHDVAYVVGMAVGEVVVGHHSLDPGDAVRGEVPGRSPDEAGAGGALLVGQDLAVGQSGVVIDHRVHVVVTDPGLLLRGCGAHGPAVGLPPAADWDLADLLNIDVDQLARAVAFVAHGRGLRRADDLAGQRVALTQVGHAVAASDPADGAGGYVELGRDPVLPATLLAACGDDRFLDLNRGLA